jgi:hypothetical protein
MVGVIGRVEERLIYILRNTWSLFIVDHRWNFRWTFVRHIIFIRPHKYTNGPTSQKVKSVLVGDGFVEKTNFTRTQRTYTLLLLEPPTSQKKVRLEFFFAFIRHSVFAPRPVWLLTVERTL